VGAIALQLVDSGRKLPLQPWRFHDTPLIRIGRSPENEVVVGSPFVSRAHAYLREGESGWELCVLSQQGVFVEGQRVEALAMGDGTIFRLSAGGPFLRFCHDAEIETIDVSSTVSYSADTPVLFLDPMLRDRQVEEIARGDYFQRLQTKVRELRQQTDTRPSSAAGPTHDPKGP
jgi:pSer/pThr/pTyr-binding forkhead associated (FHA) protein